MFLEIPSNLRVRVMLFNATRSAYGHVFMNDDDIYPRYHRKPLTVSLNTNTIISEDHGEHINIQFFYLG
jgi:hypothetical protein